MGPKSPKWPEMGREWSPALENRPTSIARPFRSLWDRSRGPKSGPEPEKFTWYPASTVSVGRIQNRHRHINWTLGLARMHSIHHRTHETKGAWSDHPVSITRAMRHWQLRQSITSMTPARDPKQVLRSRTQGTRPATSQSSVSALFCQVSGHGTGPKR